jgi:murein DD-endopeptidase MepM/ murein hydrolase activator NlpD
MSSGDPARNESWPGFGRELRAVGGGRIAAVVDERPDDRKFDPSTLAGDRMKVWGNYIVIDHGNGEFSLYGHIQKGSARVKVGQRVKQGDPIAAIGASGSSMFPHLHYELQTGIDTESEGLPSSFRGFVRVLGSRRVALPSGTIDSGDIVESR